MRGEKLSFSCCSKYALRDLFEKHNSNECCLKKAIGVCFQYTVQQVRGDCNHQSTQLVFDCV